MINDSLRWLLLATPIVLVIYYPLPRRLQNIWLLIACYTFYALWQWQQAVILLILTTVNFGLGLLLAHFEGRPRRLLLSLGVALNIFSLVFLKYDLLNKGLALIQHGTGTPADTLGLIIPLGLSFTVLQTISYLVDIANNRIPASSSPVDFALYLAYFPKVIAGPIERAKNLLPQFESTRIVDDERLIRSTIRIGVGLFRKVLIGNLLLELIPADAFTQPSNFGSLNLFLYLIIYGFGLYNDFAGYTAIARGISGLFGIDLSPNFNLPYFASSFTEFWNRWHMSFSFWLRDYIYFPLSRNLAKIVPNRKNMIHVIIPPLVTMILSGLWHGASWNMVLWGAIHGVFLMIRRIPLPGQGSFPPNQRARPYMVVGGILTFMFVILAWIPFRMALPEAGKYFRAMLNPGFIISQPMPMIAILIVMIALMLDMIELRSGEFASLQWPWPARTVALSFVIVLIFVVYLGVGPTSTFVYQDF